MRPLNLFACIKSRNRIERLYYEGGDSRKTTYRPCVVCMIDVCNYSQWCESTNARKIFETMTEYNHHISNILKSYDLLEKIEMVGDCVMVIGWVQNKKRVSEQMVRFAMDMLESIPSIQKLFDDKRISMRIGIHRGSVCCGFLSNPRKFQVFGETVNVASRIESAAENGTCMISDTTLDQIETTSTIIKVTPRGSFDFKGVSGSVGCSEIKPP